MIACLSLHEGHYRTYMHVQVQMTFTHCVGLIPLRIVQDSSHHRAGFACWQDTILRETGRLCCVKFV